jgi:hypothetical protein
MKWICVLTWAVFIATWSTGVKADDASRRQDLRQYAIKAFKDSKNHCQTLADVAGYAAKNAPDVGMWFEDLRLIIIGEDWRRRSGKRGALFMGSVTNDSGFRAELRDGSPQVEHAFAAIFLGKAAPPGASAMAGSFVELVTAGLPESKVDVADHKLYAYGTDIGSRISKFNLKDAPTAIRRTLCE